MCVECRLSSAKRDTKPKSWEFCVIGKRALKFMIAMVGALSLAVAVPALAVAQPSAHVQNNGSGTNGSGTNGSGTNGSGTDPCANNGSGTNGSGTNGSGTNGSGSGTDCNTTTTATTAFNSGGGTGPTTTNGGDSGNLAFTGESTVIPLAAAAALIALALFVRHLARSRQPE